MNTGLFPNRYEDLLIAIESSLSNLCDFRESVFPSYQV